MATASALGEFNNYINKFWGATDIIVTYGTEARFYPNQALSKVLSDPLVRQTTQRLNWLGATGNSASNTTFFIVGVDPKTDFDYATFNITGSSRISFGEAVVDNILAQKYGLIVDSTFEIFTLTSQGNIRPIPLRVTGINYPLRNLGSSIYMYLPDLQSDLKTDFDYATFNITGSSRISFGEAVVDNILAQKYGLIVDSTFEIFTLTSQGNIRPIPLRVTGINYPLRNLGSSIYMYLPDLQ